MIGVQGMDLVRSTTEILKHCALKDGDEVVVYADTGKSPAIVQSFYAAALGLGVDPVLAVFPQRREMLVEPSRSALELMRSATMVVDCATDPWLYTKGLNAILDAGGRVLQVLAAEDSLARIVPNAAQIARAEAAAKMFEKASEVRIESAGGTDLKADSHGRPGWGQDGVVRKAGDWDSAATAIYAVAPLEDRMDGTVVLEPGDFVWTVPEPMDLRERITLTVDGGRLAKIDGGDQALRLERWLASFRDPNSYVIAHTGFGGDPRASRERPQEVESLEGGINIAFGGNLFRGLGGKTRAKSHVDIVMMKQSMYLDGELVVKDGTIVHPKLKLPRSGAPVRAG
jgi:2,5-dihydroxypyridine 5,6-dioxygenase